MNGKKQVVDVDPNTPVLWVLRDHIGAAAVEFAADDLRDIEQAAAGVTLQGARLPQAALDMIDR